MARSVMDQARAVLMSVVSSITAESVLKSALRRADRTEADLERDGFDERLIAEIDRSLSVFVGSAADRSECGSRLGALAGARRQASLPAPVEVRVSDEASVVDARVQARAFARDLGFDRTDQAKIATSVSELARNIASYAEKGRVSLSAFDRPRLGMRIVATDEGPGIPNLREILAGSYRSKTGMGLGILACKRLMDDFAIESEPGRGTTITLQKLVP